MAKHNANVQLSPNQNNKQGESEAEVSKRGDVESADKEAADLLNSAIRKKKTAPTPEKEAGIFARVFKKAFNLSTKPAAFEEEQEEQGQFGTVGYHEREQTSEPPLADDATLATPTPSAVLKATTVRNSTTPDSVPHPTTPPESTTMRKRPSARPDAYDVQVSPVGLEDEDEETIGRPAKRTKRNAQAKKPIIAPKTSKGPLAASSRRTLGSQGESDKGHLDTTTKPTASARFEVAIPSYGVKTPLVKGKRGRPRKDPHLTNPTKGVADGPPASEPPNTTEESTSQALPSEEEGITDILMNPSPIKLDQPVTNQRAAVSTRNEQGRSRIEGKAPATKLSSLSADRESQSRPVEESADLESEDAIYDIKLLDEILADSKRVGYKLSNKTEWSLKRDGTYLLTPSGKRIISGLEALSSEYSGLRNAKESSNSEVTLNTQTTTAQIVRKLQAETRLILTKKLGNPSKGIEYLGKAPTVTMLADLYFNVLPCLIETIKAGTEAYTLQRSMETSALQELFDLVDILSRLVESALQQPFQPIPTTADGNIASKGRSYRILQPTKRIKEGIRSFRSKLLAELKERERAEKHAENERLKLEHKRKQREREQKEQSKKRRLAKEIHKIQNRNLAEQLADPIWGDLLMAEIMREEAREIASSTTSTRSRPRTRTQRVGNSRSQEIKYIDDQVDDNIFAIDDDGPIGDQYDEYQRVSVFENNNSRRQRGPRLWTNQEKTQFIDFFRFEQGKDRYERLAERLERSMDEIFSCAKDLQEAMDHAHENGKLNEECDEWTYDIWIDPKQRD